MQLIRSNSKLSLMRRESVEAKTGLARSTLYRLMKDGKFPLPYPLTGSRAVAWLSTEIDEWILDVTKSRNAA